jgi:hypothetical protein
LIIKEDAITVRKFNQALANPNFSHIFIFKLFDIRKLQLGSQLLNLFPVDPHVTGRTRTAISALRALKPQSLVIPFPARHRFCPPSWSQLTLLDQSY